MLENKFLKEEFLCAVLYALKNTSDALPNRVNSLNSSKCILLFFFHTSLLFTFYILWFLKFPIFLVMLRSFHIYWSFPFLCLYIAIILLLGFCSPFVIVCRSFLYLMVNLLSYMFQIFGGTILTYLCFASCLPWWFSDSGTVSLQNNNFPDVWQV